MTSQDSPEQPPPTEPHLSQTPNSVPPDEPSPPISNKNGVSESNPQHVDAKTDQFEHGDEMELLADDGNEKTPGGVQDHQTNVQKLRSRVSDLEQRLRRAGLLDKLEDESDSEAAPKEKARVKNRAYSSSRDSAENENDNGKTTESLTETNDQEKSVQVLVDKIDSLERRLEEAGHLKDKPAVDKPRLPAIPQLHYVDWLDFKNKVVGDEKVYAVEVLIGGAKYYYQRSEEDRKRKQRSKDRSGDRDQPIIEDAKSKPLPERIRINSKPILLIMKEIDPTDWGESPVVMLRPYKSLIYHEDRIREVFERLQSRWGNAETEPTTNQAVESTVTEDAHDSTKTALSDGAIDSVPTKSDAHSKTKTTADHIDADTAKRNEKMVTRRDSISSPPTANIPPPSIPSVNNSIDQSDITDIKDTSSKAKSEPISASTRNEETEDLADSLEALKDPRCLIRFIDLELKPVVDSFGGNTRRKVFFSDLWHLYKPGDLLYCPLGNKNTWDHIMVGHKSYPQKPNDRFQEAFRIVCTAGGRPHLESTSEKYQYKENDFLISAYWVDFNATRFGSRNYVFSMVSFPGERDITSLQCYPLRYCPKANELKTKWKARGEAFHEYMTFQYRYYIGKTLTCAPDGVRRPEDELPKHSENVESQVVVDFSEAFAAYPGWRTNTGANSLASADYTAEFSEDYPTSYWKDHDWKTLDDESDDEIYDDKHIDTKLMEEYIERDPLLRDHPTTSFTGNDELDEDHQILLPNRVFGFVMKNRKWALLTIDGLRPIKRYVDGFNDLQLPMGHKRTISSLVNNHFINRNAELDDLEASYDADLVRGKGKGLIILLHGAPGVGKTSTAETAADAFRKMLFPITCGDLGLTAAHVESELSEKFHLAELWDCVLLLDEADVFLARRTNNDIKRNSLVSVFLRVLEHFTGVLFMTTNRVGAFDEAFKSRIHISLYYPPLNEEQTRSIWKMNLERLDKKKQRRNESMLFNEKEIFAYAQNHYTETSARKANWNGRQIRNAFQTASALAEFEAHERNRKAKARSAETGEVFIPTDPQLKVRHFQEIARASYEFDEYIAETKGFTDAEIAYREGQRMDDYPVNRRVVRDREQQPTKLREAPPLRPATVHGLAPKANRRAAPAGHTSAGGNRQTYVRAPVAFTHDGPESQDPKYDQPAAPAATAVPRSERSSVARFRPKPVQRLNSFAAHDRERQRHEAFEQHEPQYEDEDEEEPEYEPLYEESFSRPAGTYLHSEDTNHREISPRRRQQAGDLPAKSRKPAVLGYGEDLEDDEDTYYR